MAIREYLKFVTLAFILLLISCSENPVSPEPEPDFLKIDARLDKDERGYYHLVLNRNQNQTLHRISAVTNHDGDFPVKVGWDAFDMTGNIKTWTYTDGFGRRHVVDIINHVSYSDSEGIVNTMFAPVRSMVGDTVIVGSAHFLVPPHINLTLPGKGTWFPKP